jgi:hypothetical protein
MHRKWEMAFGIALATALMASCSGLTGSSDTDTKGNGTTQVSNGNSSTTTNKYLPSAISVAFPASLSSSARDLTNDEAYAQLSQAVSIAKVPLVSAAMLLTFADEAICQNSLSPSTTTADETFTVTQALVARVAKIAGNAGLGSSQSADSYAGATLTLTNFNYGTVSDTTYAYGVKMTFEKQNISIYWSSDNTKLKYSVSSDDPVAIGNEDFLVENDLRYDSDAGTSCFAMFENPTDPDSLETPISVNIKIATDASSANGGISIGYYDTASITPKAYLVAYADDSGSAITCDGDTFTFDSAGSPTSSATYASKLDSAASALSVVATLMSDSSSISTGLGVTTIETTTSDVPLFGIDTSSAVVTPGVVNSVTIGVDLPLILLDGYDAYALEWFIDGEAIAAPAISDVFVTYGDETGTDHDVGIPTSGLSVAIHSLTLVATNTSSGIAFSQSIRFAVTD